MSSSNKKSLTARLTAVAAVVASAAVLVAPVAPVHAVESAGQYGDSSLQPRAHNFEADLRDFADNLSANFKKLGKVSPHGPGQKVARQRAVNPLSAVDKIKESAVRLFKGMQLMTWDPETRESYGLQLTPESVKKLSGVSTEPARRRDEDPPLLALVEEGADAAPPSYDEPEAPPALLESLAQVSLAAGCCCNTGFAREKITSPKTKDPYYKIGMVKLGCTATLIGDRVAVTAAHCVWDSANNKPYALADLDFYPGRDGPAGIHRTIRVQQTWVSKNYKDGTNPQNDIGFLVFASKTNLGYAGFKADQTGSVSLAGYPLQTRTAGTYQFMWRDKCTLTKHAGTLRSTHMCDTEGGNSGSSIFVETAASKGEYVAAIHSGVLRDASANVCTQLTSPGTFELVKTLKYKFV